MGYGKQREERVKGKGNGWDIGKRERGEGLEGVEERE